MSDGPHRSLNMRLGWKKAAEFADYDAFAPEEVRNAVASAFTGDWRADVPDSVAGCISEVLGGQQDSLFRDQKVMQLEALRPMTAGHGLAQVLLDCAIQKAESGFSGPDAVVEAAADALDVWGARHGRQIEEHYCRESTVRRADHVRARIEEGIGGVSREALARQLLKVETTAPPRKPPKQTGLDEGVQL